MELSFDPQWSYSLDNKILAESQVISDVFVVDILIRHLNYPKVWTIKSWLGILSSLKHLEDLL